MPHSDKKEMDDEISKLIDSKSRLDHRILLTLLVLGVLVVVVSCFGIFKPVHDAPEVWFQRSGSIAVFIALLVEYNVQKNKIFLADCKPSDFKFWKTNHLYNFHKLHIYSISLGVIGTIIWGYGDLLYKAFI